MIRLSGLLLAAILLGLAFGEVHLPPSAILRWDGAAELLIGVIRAPRVAVAVLAGAALGLAGALLQSLLRNPLASPDVLGFTSGAGLGAMLVVALGGGALSITLGAASGGVLAALAVTALSWKSGIVPLRMILVGIGASFTLQAITQFMMTRLTGAEAVEAARWLSGSLAARHWGHAMQIGLCLAVLLPLAALSLRALRLLELGDEVATGLGLHVTRARAGIAALAVALVASAVAVAGPVPFVALLAGPLAVRFGAPMLLGAAVVGAIVTVLADLAARGLIDGVQLPLGVMTGILGAPYLLWMLSREMERGRL
ncbi:FecCD family ABC transporter permease [Falsirhodobacter xinxiangensis]|uniref:FecCD family ABC transporter permease n=1 Tax=Falsirhodobacter xinxiangensis TaxID=2530049 RepID=UPI0010AA035C|nr:iron ABC transporter permease [Rhodobacter xinxiangensis]